MARDIIKKYMPDPKKIKENKFLNIFGSLLHDPRLWTINRRNIARAFSVGLFMAYVPVPFQMVLAAGAAIIFKSNMPISVALVWFSNPATMPFLYPLAYILGAYVLGILPENFTFEAIYTLITADPLNILWPFLFGCFLFGVTLGILGNISIRAFWKYKVLLAWRARKKRRKNKENT